MRKHRLSYKEGEKKKQTWTLSICSWAHVNCINRISLWECITSMRTVPVGKWITLLRQCSEKVKSERGVSQSMLEGKKRRETGVHQDGHCHPSNSTLALTNSRQEHMAWQDRDMYPTMTSSPLLMNTDEKAARTKWKTECREGKKRLHIFSISYF